MRLGEAGLRTEQAAIAIDATARLLDSLARIARNSRANASRWARGTFAGRYDRFGSKPASLAGGAMSTGIAPTLRA